MRSRHSHMTLIAASDSTTAISEPRLVGRNGMFAGDSISRTPDETALSDAVFRSLIKFALRRVEKSPLSRTMTALLGISRDDEVILTKQIGILEGGDLHGLIVSVKPNTDDIILVAKTNTKMEVYLTDSCCRLRAAATLQRDSDQPELVKNKHAVIAFARELEAWKILAKKMSH